MAHARPRVVTSPDTKARALALRAGGARVHEVCAQVDIGTSTFHSIRSEVGGAERFDAMLAELRHMLSRGASEAQVIRRAKQFLLGAETSKEAAEANESPLTFDAVAAVGMKLFANKAENARGATRERFEAMAEPSYWQGIKFKVALFLGGNPDDASPAQLLRAVWVACRDIEGVRA